MKEIELIKQRVDNICFDQYEPDRFRILIDRKTILDTNNAAEAKMCFLGEIERKVNKHLSALLEKQGINPVFGTREDKYRK